MVSVVYILDVTVIFNAFSYNDSYIQYNYIEPVQFLFHPHIVLLYTSIINEEPHSLYLIS